MMFAEPDTLQDVAVAPARRYPGAQPPYSSIWVTNANPDKLDADDSTSALTISDASYGMAESQAISPKAIAVPRAIVHSCFMSVPEGESGCLADTPNYRWKLIRRGVPPPTDQVPSSSRNIQLTKVSVLLRLWRQSPAGQAGAATSSSSASTGGRSRYQSTCFDHRAQARHWVSRHVVRHAGHRPPVSNVFQLWPHAHDQRSPAEGSQSHRGQATLTTPRSGTGRRGPSRGCRSARRASPRARPSRPGTGSA